MFCCTSGCELSLKAFLYQHRPILSHELTTVLHIPFTLCAHVNTCPSCLRVISAHRDAVHEPLACDSQSMPLSSSSKEQNVSLQSFADLRDYGCHRSSEAPTAQPLLQGASTLCTSTCHRTSGHSPCSAAWLARPSHGGLCLSPHPPG